jgi:hypothetical protein
MNSTQRLSWICMILVLFLISLYAISLELIIVFIPFATATMSAMIIYSLIDKKEQKDFELFTDQELNEIINRKR